jgi:uncharacterized membrane protein YeaQ/YmgE (transglycosylase-associated protein family)
MIDHLVFATDLFFGKDILDNAAGGAQLIAEGFNELWQETLNGSLYGALCKVGQLFAVATLCLYMVELAKNFINQEDMKALSSFIWPIIVISMLANDAALLKSATLSMREMINTVNNDVIKYAAAGVDMEVAFNRAVGNIALQQQVGAAMERCRSIPGSSKDSADCLQQAEVELRKSAPDLFKGSEPPASSGLFNPLEALTDAKEALENLSPGQIGEKITSSINGAIGSMITGFVAALMLALNNAYQWGIEFTMLLTALLGPLAIGGSLLPFGAKPIFAWLTGYLSVGMAKLCFNMITGLCAQLIANSEQNQPMIFLLFIGLISPILSSALAAGGGLAVWTGLGKAAVATTQFAGSTISATANSWINSAREKAAQAQQAVQQSQQAAQQAQIINELKKMNRRNK